MVSTQRLAPSLPHPIPSVYHTGSKNTANGAAKGIKNSQLQKDSEGVQHLAAPWTFTATLKPYQDCSDRGPKSISRSSQALASDGLGLRRGALREPFNSIGSAD